MLNYYYDNDFDREFDKAVDVLIKEKLEKEKLEKEERK